MSVEFTSAAKPSKAVMPTGDGSPTPADLSSSGCIDRSPELGPVNGDLSGRYMCSLCETLCSYRAVRHTGRCPTCGGGVVRLPDVVAQPFRG